MGIVHRIIATTSVAAGLTLAVAGVANAQPQEPEDRPTCPLAQWIETWPPAPEGCAAAWDPIEDAIEDSVPEPAQQAFDAFDDWCEGDED